MTVDFTLDVGRVLAAALYTVFAIQVFLIPGDRSARGLFLVVISLVQAAAIMGLSIFSQWEFSGRITFGLAVLFLVSLNWNVYIFKRESADGAN